MKELLELAGIFGIASALMLLMCIVFSVMYRKNKEIPFFKRSIVCGIGAFAAAVVWFIQKTPEHHISNWPILLFPALFVLIVALVMILKGNSAYKEEQALAEERRWQEEKERKAKQNGYQNYETSGGLREGVKTGSKKFGAGLARNYESLKTPGEQKSIFSNPGTQIKWIAERSFIIECIASVFGTFCFAVLADEFTFMTVLIAVGILFGGVFSAYLVSLFFYGIGESMENIAATKENSQATREDVHALLDTQKDSE